MNFLKPALEGPWLYRSWEKNVIRVNAGPAKAGRFFGGCVAGGLGVVGWTTGGREGLLGANELVGREMLRADEFVK